MDREEVCTNWCATANNIDYIPAEILRKGRFDEIFFINLPNQHERRDIFNIHLQKVRPLTWEQYNTFYLSQISIKFSGSESTPTSVLTVGDQTIYGVKTFAESVVINGSLILTGSVESYSITNQVITNLC